MSDVDPLITRVRRFEAQAIAQVYDAHSDELYRYSWRLLGDQDLAEDCVAETFSRFLHAIKRGGGPNKNLRAYLFRMAHNWITDYYRRSNQEAVPLNPDMKDERQDEPGEIILRRIEGQATRQALLDLTPEQRQVIVLRYLEDWSHQEVAASMEKSVGAVKALQNRAINALRRKMIEEQDQTDDG